MDQQLADSREASDAFKRFKAYTSQELTVGLRPVPTAEIAIVDMLKCIFVKGKF